LTIADATKLKKEVLSGEILGFVRLYKAMQEGPESSPERILSMTYPSSDIRNILAAIDQKLKGKRADGTS